MAIRLESIKCPDCGANVPMENGKSPKFCSYCGASLLLVNDNEHVYRYIDDAEITRAETEHIARMKELELLERQQEERAYRLSMSRRKEIEEDRHVKFLRQVRLGTMIAVIVAVVLLFLAINMDWGDFSIWMIFIVIILAVLLRIEKRYLRELEGRNLAKIPSEAALIESASFTVVEEAFRAAGFTNIRCVDLKDLTLGIRKKPGVVASITVDGKEIEAGGGRVPFSAPVVISYHSFAQK